ncbi:cobalt-precorrin-5B (C(1))-methyltransferase CbiD [Methanobacterium alcaliphilum]|uniref:cobalt-precorrin-5B (C(1))-methyltransferase CbiD n=1 Tax=Methanobacterium alcaliphilum TaxID=392018 RepID=UPI00200B6E4F|nr:cobalt-precorrin-5B (C(1))-methyltransferase CbiD [Methanobacterium alcaliphilum]MCK9150866.1 cobalt-precorrin-5B (C(1))-methyltransferase CbiD [Methanobacterium alcaliphilum]
MSLKDKGESFGITTGSAATAAALASLFCIKNNDPNISIVEIKTPFDKLKIEIEELKKLSSSKAQAIVVKKPYSDPDVTINQGIGAKVELFKGNGIIIEGGDGVGIITKPGLQIGVGKAAINPVPRQMIKENLGNYLNENEGALVTIFVPQGKKIASRTMNPRLGIENGISILGTTGIARSMSMASYKKALTCQIDVAQGLGYEKLIFVPGNIGEKLALKLLKAEKDQIIQMSNCVGHMLKTAVDRNVKKIILFGHAGKLVKIAGGIFNTKHSVADGRKEIIAAHTALSGGSKDLIKRIFDSKTTEDMIDILSEYGLQDKVFKSIAHSIKEQCQVKYPLDIDVIIVRMDGTVLAELLQKFK